MLFRSQLVPIQGDLLAGVDALSMNLGAPASLPARFSNCNTPARTPALQGIRTFSSWPQCASDCRWWRLSMNHQAKPKLNTQISEFTSFGLPRPMHRQMPFLISRFMTPMSIHSWRLKLYMNLRQKREQAPRTLNAVAPYSRFRNFAKRLECVQLAGAFGSWSRCAILKSLRLPCMVQYSAVLACVEFPPFPVSE